MEIQSCCDFTPEKCKNNFKIIMSCFRNKSVIEDKWQNSSQFYLIALVKPVCCFDLSMRCDHFFDTHVYFQHFQYRIAHVGGYNFLFRLGVLYESGIPEFHRFLFRPCIFCSLERLTHKVVSVFKLILICSVYWPCVDVDLCPFFPFS